MNEYKDNKDAFLYLDPPYMDSYNRGCSSFQSKTYNDDLTIIDIASGPGEPACTIAKSIPKATVFSTDISIDMHKISSIQSINIKNLKSIVLDAQDLSIFSTSSG